MPPRKLPKLKTDSNTLPPIESQYMSRVPFICLVNGSTGCGKTTIIMSIIKLMRREHSLTKLYLMCPSYTPHSVYHAILKDTDVVFTDMSKCFEALKAIEQDCELEAERWRKELEYVITFNRYTAGETINAQDEQLLEEYGYRTITPIRPSPILLCDDCSHSQLFSKSSKNPFPAMVLRSRHVAGGTGLSIAMISHSFTSGVPRCLRTNSTHGIYFGTQSERELKSIYEETNGQLSWVHFRELFHHYTARKLGYLFVDNIKRDMCDSF